MKTESVIICKNIEVRDSFATLIDVYSGVQVEQLPTLVPFCIFIGFKAEAGDIGRHFNCRVNLISPRNDRALDIANMDFDLSQQRFEIRLTGQISMIEFGGYTLRIMLNNEIKYNDIAFSVNQVQIPAPLDVIPSTAG